MTFQITRKGEVAVVEVEGPLVVTNRHELRQRVLEALEAGARKFVIDFKKTGYIDSSGLAILVQLWKKIQEQSGELRLANLNPDLRSFFELARLDSVLTIADSREAALKGL